MDEYEWMLERAPYDRYLGNALFRWKEQLRLGWDLVVLVPSDAGREPYVTALGTRPGRYRWYEYRWGNNELRRQRKGQRCRILAMGTKGTVLVEFEDGFRMTTSWKALREYFQQPTLFDQEP